MVVAEPRSSSSSDPRTSTASRSGCAPRSSRCRSSRSRAGPARCRSRRSRSRASARSRTPRLGGAHGSIWAVFLARARDACRSARCSRSRPCGCRVSYLALATLAFAAMVEEVFFTQPFAVGAGARSVERVHMFGIDFATRIAHRKPFLILVTVVFGLCGIGVVALAAQRVRPAAGRAARQRGGVGDRRRQRARDEARGVHAVGRHRRASRARSSRCQLGTLNGAQGFPMIAGLADRARARHRRRRLRRRARCSPASSGSSLIIIQDDWHISLWLALEYLAPGLAVLGIIQNPSGAVVPIGEGFARLLPWRQDARREYEEMTAATARAGGRRARPRARVRGGRRAARRPRARHQQRRSARSRRRRERLTMALLEIEEVSVQFGGLLAVDEASISVPAGSRDRTHRPERRGQDHALQRHHRAAGADAGRVRARRRRRHRGAGRIAAPASASRARSSGSRRSAA